MKQSRQKHNYLPYITVKKCYNTDRMEKNPLLSKFALYKNKFTDNEYR